MRAGPGEVYDNWVNSTDPLASPTELVTSFTSAAPAGQPSCPAALFPPRIDLWRSLLAGAVLPGPAGDGDRDRAGRRHAQPLPSAQLDDGQPERRPRQGEHGRVGLAAARRVAQAHLHRLLSGGDRLHRLRPGGRFPLSLVAHPAGRRLAAVLGGHGVHLPHPGGLRLRVAERRA